MEINATLVQKLKNMRKEGIYICDMIREIHNFFGLKSYVRGITFLYLRAVFSVSINDLSVIGGWKSFEDGGNFTDEEIESQLTNLIVKG